MKYLKLPSDFDTPAELQAYLAGGEWKKERRDFATPGEWNEYQEELGVAIAAYQAEAVAQQRQATLLKQLKRLKDRGVPSEQAVDWINRTARFRA